MVMTISLPYRYAIERCIGPEIVCIKHVTVTAKSSHKINRDDTRSA